MHCKDIRSMGRNTARCSYHSTIRVTTRLADVTRVVKEDDEDETLEQLDNNPNNPIEPDSGAGGEQSQLDLGEE